MDVFDVDASGAGEMNPEIKKWLDELSKASKREKEWRQEANKIVQIFEAAKKEKYSFNILYSNTETLAPSLYSIAPRPRVVRRYKDEDPLSKHACRVVQRILEFSMDSGQGEYSDFDELMRQAVIEGLVPGRGLARFKYDAAIKEEAPENVEEKGEITSPKVEKVSYEAVCGEEIPWNNFLHGMAKKWCHVPWIAIIHHMDKMELEANFGKEVAAKVKLTKGEEKGTGDDAGDDPYGRDGDTKPAYACVYEIWDKYKRDVRFVSDGYPEGYLKDPIPDPLQLTGFFPVPKPLYFTKKISNMIPVPLYFFYQEQADELNRVTKRINKITEALKIRGFYDQTLEGMEDVMKADDNTLVPTANVAALQQGQSLENSIWLMPIEKLVGVLQQLYIQRAEIKQVIYEVTGISDIMRSSSVASESATAQKIKQEWGNLRLRRWQREVQRFAREALRIIAEIAVTKLSIETIQQMTGLDYPTMQEKQQLQMQADMMLQQMPPEQQQQAMQSPEAMQMQERMALPSWEEIIQMLQNDALRSYKIDIETNSTLDADVSEDKTNMSDFIDSLSQFFLAVTPLVEKGTLPFEAAQAMLMHMTRRFNFGPDVEDQLMKMQPPQQGGGEEAQKAMEEAEKAKEEVTKAQQKLQQDQMKFQEQQMQAEHDLRIQQMELEYQRKEFAMEVKMAQQEMKLQEKSMAQNIKQTQQTASMAIQGQMHGAEMAENQRRMQAEKENQDSEPKSE